MQIRLDLPDEAATVPLCRRVVRALLMDLGMGVAQVADIELVVSEATGNTTRHAYEHPGRRYQFSLTVEADRVRVMVVDQGRGFVRSMIEAPDLQQESGRGLWIMEQLADTVTLATLPGGGCCLEAEFLCSHLVPVTELP
jgi:anti-sigma regulatory factor (Ser/Thr protein kinase)